jgi:hypothetical protein
MTDLRNHLFETLEALKDKEAPMEIDRARAISKVAQTIIESAKVEVQFIKEMGRPTADQTPFFDTPPIDKPALRLAK